MEKNRTIVIKAPIKMQGAFLMQKGRDYMGCKKKGKKKK